MAEQCGRGPRKTWSFRPRRHVPLWISLSYGDPYGTRRWGATWYGSGTSNYRTPWGALLGARRNRGYPRHAR